MTQNISNVLGWAEATCGPQCDDVFGPNLCPAPSQAESSNHMLTVFSKGGHHWVKHKHGGISYRIMIDEIHAFCIPVQYLELTHSK